MKFKTLGDKITVVLMVGCLLSLLYGVALAVGVNRILGSNIVGSVGGVSIHKGDGADTAWVLPGYGLTFVDSHVVADTTTLKTGFANYFAKVGEVVKYGRKSGGADAKVYDSLLFAEGTDITITQSGNTFTFAYSGVGGGAWYGQHVNGQSISTDTMVWLPEYGILMRQAGGAKQDTIAVKVDTTTLKDVFATPYGLGDSLGDYLTETATRDAIHDTFWADISGYASKVDIHDSLFANTPGYATKGNIHDSLFANTPDYATKTQVHDSTWVWDHWSPSSPSIDTAYDTGIEIFYPITLPGTPSHINVVRFVNNSGSNDKKGIFVWSGKLPGGFKADVDSFNIGIMTSDTDTLVTKVNVNIYAMNDQIGWAPADSSKFAGVSYASSVANTWRWITIAGGSIGAIAPLSDVFIHIEATADNGKMVQVEGPERMGFLAWRK